MNYKSLYIERIDKNGEIYYELVANEYSGMGVDCNNISENVKSNYNDVYKDINLLINNEETLKFKSNEELKKYLNTLGLEYNSKKLVIIE